MGTNLKAIDFSELQALGVPLDWEILERTRAVSLGLQIQVIESAVDATIFDAQFGGIILMIHAAIHNDSLKVIRLDECQIELPWEDPDFRLLQASWRKMPREYMYSSSLAPTLQFESEAVLNHRFGRRGRLNPGALLDGMILGAGIQPIPDRYQHRQRVDVQLAIIDGRGKVYLETARVMLDRSVQLMRQRKARDRASARTSRHRELVQELVLA